MKHIDLNKNTEKSCLTIIIAKLIKLELLTKTFVGIISLAASAFDPH